MNLKNHIGLKVKSARLQQGLTQEQLAGELGKSVETISNLERGFYMTGLKTLQKVGQCLKVPMTYFFEGADDKRKVSKTRLEWELEIRRLAEDLPDKELRLSIRLLKDIADDGRA